MNLIKLGIEITYKTHILGCSFGHIKYYIRS